MQEAPEKNTDETEAEGAPQPPSNNKLWRGMDEGEKFGRLD